MVKTSGTTSCGCGEDEDGGATAVRFILILVSWILLIRILLIRMMIIATIMIRLIFQVEGQVDSRRPGQCGRGGAADQPRGRGGRPGAGLQSGHRHHQHLIIST